MPCTGTYSGLRAQRSGALLAGGEARRGEARSSLASSIKFGELPQLNGETKALGLRVAAPRRRPSRRREREARGVGVEPQRGRDRPLAAHDRPRRAGAQRSDAATVEGLGDGGDLQVSGSLPMPLRERLPFAPPPS